MNSAHDLLIKKLHDFSLPLNFVQEEHERRIITAVVRKLAQLSEDALFRVYKSSKLDGRFALELKAHSGSSPRGSAPERILLDEVQRKGALSWCVENGQDKEGFWVEGIRSAADPAKLKNKFDGEEIGDSYTDFIDDPDTVIAVPLRTANSEVIGIIAVQFEKETHVSRQFANILTKISTEVTRIIRKSNETTTYIRNTTDAVEGFLDDIQSLELSPELLEPRSKVGFIARPFSDEFNEVGKELERLLAEEGCEALAYSPDRPGGLVASEVMGQIKNARFGVADITGSNPNVLMEVGVMIASKKDVLLLRDHNDTSETPFNLSNYHAHEYRQTKDGQLEIKRPTESAFSPFAEALKPLLKDLAQE